MKTPPLRAGNEGASDYVGLFNPNCGANGGPRFVHELGEQRPGMSAVDGWIPIHIHAGALSATDEVLRAHKGCALNEHGLWVLSIQHSYRTAAITTVCGKHVGGSRMIVG